MEPFASVVETRQFAELNDELKAGIRFSEAVLHQAMQSLLAVFPESLRPAAAPILADIPLQFLVSQLPLYRHVDGLYKTHQRLVAENPAALPKQ
jgi:hypothetical protein